jgi:hypothetical protein
VITGSFGSKFNLKTVVGYKISAVLTPGEGFQDYFYVYVADMQSAPDRFERAVNVGTEGAPARDTLQILGDGRNYSFKEIDLLSAEVGATRRHRYRLLEFKYTQARLRTPNLVTVPNSSKSGLKDGGLGDDYKYALGGAAENLLGFRYRPAATGANAVRFCALRNNQNSFLEKMIKANDEMAQGNEMSDFTVTFTQEGQSFPVTKENLLRMYIDESFGYLAGEELSPLSSIVTGAEPDTIAQAVRSKLADYTGRRLLEFEDKTDSVARESDSRAVETATFVFKTGEAQNKNITYALR